MARNFKQFAAAIARQWDKISKKELFRVNVDGDAVWAAYLAAFPEGTNPIFRVRTEHDGSYDRSFIRRVGNVVTADGESIWDAPDLAYPYDVVTAALAELLHGREITGIFRAPLRESQIGRESSPERLPNGTTHIWNHFHAAIAPRHRVASPDEAIGEAATTVGVLTRGVREITPAALNTILDLIDSNALYRGAEFRPAVVEFKKLQAAVKTKSPWVLYDSPAARFRNTVIGTLAVDLSDGLDEEAAVSAYEKKVAPENYKRPTAVVTKGMVDQAVKTINELGLEPALARRYARLSDLSVNDILWVANASKAKLRDGVAGLLADVAVAKPSKGAAEAVSVEYLLEVILPQATTCEALFSGRLKKNLVSITAAMEPDAPRLFKWNNGFAWSYNGEITDAIKERVKAAGGNILADLRVSLAWHNFDDLDLHCDGPYGHVYYGNKLGILDVDMNAGVGKTRTPVENLAFNKPRDGAYRIFVHQFNARETQNPGFTVEIENNGQVSQLTYPNRVVGHVEVGTLFLRGGRIVEFTPNPLLRHENRPEDIWGVKTETFVPVATIMNSPNHWGGESVGNKHTFFLLDGCRNPEPTRGLYNEFLRGDLDKHRKVFEILGTKTRCEPSNEQLSGLGFSSTVRETVTVRVTGPSINKTYEVKF